MSIETFSITIKPKLPYPFQRDEKVLKTEFDSGIDVARRLLRFPKATVPIGFPPLLIADRNTLYSFFRRNSYKPFWFVDFDSRSWNDEFVGYAGPWNLAGCFKYNPTSGLYVDETDDANNTTVGDVSPHPTTGVAEEFVILSDFKFDKTTVVISTAGTGDYTSSWKYSKNDGTWAAITIVDGTGTGTDGTTSFKHAPGSCDITLTMPTDWDKVEYQGANGYGLKCTFNTGTVTIAPLVTSITTNSKIFDLHCKTSSAVAIYLDGVLKTLTTDYTLLTGGGDALVDRLSLNSYPTQGVLITADHTGYLRIKSRFQDTKWREDGVTTPLGTLYFGIDFTIEEVQW